MQRLASSGVQLDFPSWGRSFWQDPDDGALILFYASGTSEVDYITSTDSGVTWSSPTFAFPVDNFAIHNNFDTTMDRDGNIHCVHRHNTSGCYTLFAKTGAATWAPSGTISRGFFDCRATTVAKDFNGAIEVYDYLFSDFTDPASAPAARIAAVDNSGLVGWWYLDSPYTGFPLLLGRVSGVPVGPSGGYPTPTDHPDNRMGSPFSVDGTGLYFSYKSFNGLNTLDVIDIDPNAADDVKGSGDVGDLPLGPNMVWLKTHYFVDDFPWIDTTYPFIVSQGGDTNFELYATINDMNGPGAKFCRVKSSGNNITVGDYPHFNRDDYPFKQLQGNIAGADPIGGSGVNVGAAVLDEKQTMHFYFQNRLPNGLQSIYRMKCFVTVPNTADNPSRTRFFMSELTDPASGIISWADATVSNAGAGGSGLENIIHWHGFKVAQSPVGAGSGNATRTEIIATIGSGIDNAGTPNTVSHLYTYNYDESIHGQNLPQDPTYLTNLIDNTAFSGILRESGSTGNTSNMVDLDPSTFGTVQNGATITLAFNDVYNIGRIEFLWDTSPVSFMGVHFFASLDDSTYYPVHDYPIGSDKPLVKSSAEVDIPFDTTINYRMKPFAAKYIKMDFDYPLASAANIEEIRIYGAQTVNGYTYTSGDTSIFYPNFGSERIEDFGGIAQGTLPEGWTTSGSFDWFVDKGTHQSGFFLGDTYGSGNTSALRIDRNAPVSTSGWVDIPYEVTETRNVSFDVKWDLQGNIGPIDPAQTTDDYVFLYLITPTGTVNKTDDLFGGVYSSPSDYKTVTITMSDVGSNTLRFVYRRGSIPIGSGVTGGEGTIWVDNITSDPSPSDPNLLTTIYGFTEGAPIPATGQVQAYVSGVEGEDLTTYAYMSGSANTPSGTIYSYLDATGEASGVIYGYTKSVTATGNVFGFLEGFIDKESGVAYGYMNVSGADAVINAYINNKANESVYGYMKVPSGSVGQVYGFTQTPEFFSVYGYMSGPAKTSGDIAAYTKGLDYDNHIYAYLTASGLNEQIYGYIKAEGATIQVYGYMPNGERIEAYGFIKGASPISGVINSYMSGVGISSGVAYGYTFGVSGIPTGVFNGFVEGAQAPNGSIYALTYGFDSGEGCDFPVPNPSSVAVPTGNFFT